MLDYRLESRNKRFNTLQGVAPNKNEEENAGGHWAFAQFRHIPQPNDVAHVHENNPVDDNGPEEEEEEDPAHPHRR